MQDDTDFRELDSCEPLHLAELPAYKGGQSRFGFNPWASGYRTAVARRRALLLAACSAVVFISGSLWVCERIATWQAVLGVMGPILPLAAMEWSWRRSRFCESCGARTKGPGEPSALVWCRACHCLTDPAGITVEPVGQFDLTKSDYMGHIDPILRFLDSAVLTGIENEAQEIRFEPGEHAYEIRLAMGDKIYALAPSPNWLATPVAQAVKVVAGLDVETWDRRQEGHIHLKCGGHDVCTDVVVEPTKSGPKVTLRFVSEYWNRPCQCPSCLSAVRSVEV